MKVLLGLRRTQKNELQMKVSELLGGIIVWKYWLGIGHAFREAYLFCFTPSFLPLPAGRAHASHTGVWENPGCRAMAQ